VETDAEKQLRDSEPKVPLINAQSQTQEHAETMQQRPVNHGQPAEKTG